MGWKTTVQIHYSKVILYTEYSLKNTYFTPWCHVLEHRRLVQFLSALKLKLLFFYSLGQDIPIRCFVSTSMYGIAQLVQWLATGWTTEGLDFESRQGQEFSLLHVVQTGSGSTQPPILWAPGLLSLGESSRGMKLTTHLQPVSRSRKCGPIHPLPHMPTWCST
jgi:hypothetical protein